jgi:2-polyprenyl-6-methoxyphenol hydroxylase-like FAD-dependent oxidoreductase
MTDVSTSRHAIVVGGSIAGLLAARVLADHFICVTVLERDILPDAPAARRGIPQARHAHALLGRGREALEELFAGLTQQLVAAGALQGGGRFFTGGGYLSRITSGPAGLFVSRELLEHTVRERVRALSNVRILDGHSVRGLVTDVDGARVCGVRLSGPAAGADEELLAELVVDATGRGSRAPAWLRAIGYLEPREELVEVGMGYSTRHYRRTPEHLAGDLMVNVAPSPQHRRACGMLAQEGDRWIVTLAGYFGDHPPTDDRGYRDFAASLPAREVAEIVATAEPLGAPVTYRFQANQRRRYEELSRFPDGFLVIGDALCSFTPIYGQGMTVAAVEVLALRDCLAQGQEQLARRFFRRAAGIIDIAWTIAVGNDLRLSGAPSARRPAARFINWYLGRLQVAARHDSRLALAFMRVGSLYDAPPSLLRPGTALRVLWGNLHRPGYADSDEAAPASVEAGVDPAGSLAG